MRELLRHRRLVAAAHLGEAGEARSDDEPLPVRRELFHEGCEEARSDRSGADEAHVAAHDVPELRNLVQLGCAQPATGCSRLFTRALDELLAEVGAEPFLGVRAQRPELEHLEDAPAAPDALAPVEERSSARDQEDEAERQHDRDGAEERLGPYLGEELVQRTREETTATGGWLRATQLDEIPQLWNVVRGDMSLVGPRPIRPRFFAALVEELPAYWQRLVVRPGLTGFAQVRRGYETSMAEKLAHDLEWIADRSLRLYFRTLVTTAWRVLGQFARGLTARS
jgi:hypothetical protein